MKIIDYSASRQELVEKHIVSRGVRSENVLRAMREVPRELFLPDALKEFAYEDVPLPIEKGQTISQPFIVALMVEALSLNGGEKVLEIGTGSGYAAAILSKIAAQVYTIERIKELAEKASQTLSKHGYDNVQVINDDGTLGWPQQAPYDAIIVAAAGPKIPEQLKKQLKVGGRLVIPVGDQPRVQELVRITRLTLDDFKQEDLADVTFVPLIGQAGWSEPASVSPVQAPLQNKEVQVSSEICKQSDVFDELENYPLDSLIERIGDARVVLLGESSHGTSEFYRTRALITQALIEKHGFNFVAIEADWPDAARIDHYTRHFEYPATEWMAFSRFPSWMWRNHEVRTFIDWLRDYNQHKSSIRRAAFYGLDLYSLYNSIRAILKYLDAVDPETAAIARHRYGCLNPWQSDPATYGHAAIRGTYQSCEADVVQMLIDLLRKRSEYEFHDGERYLDLVQNARLVINAEKYYRIMYYGSRASWNLRDEHMYDTLLRLLEFHGANSKAIVWAHNSHIGNAQHTEMFSRGEHNIGYLCKKKFNKDCFTVGFGTDHGIVAAASNWDGPLEFKDIVPAVEKSHEFLFHQTGIPMLSLPLTKISGKLNQYLKSQTRLERAIGVIYRPETELTSHYFQALLGKQFDEYIWFDKTSPIQPFTTQQMEGMPDTYPFGL